jgi:hypothetical protein
MVHVGETEGKSKITAERGKKSQRGENTLSDSWKGERSKEIDLFPFFSPPRVREGEDVGKGKGIISFSVVLSSLLERQD